MNFIPLLIFTVIILCVLWYIFLYIVDHKIVLFEKKLLTKFFARTDMFPALFEITKPYVSKHSHIFEESMKLRKQEFHLRDISHSVEAFKEIETHIHHEINFIFRVCNSNPNLLKDKKFLYLRDIMMKKSLGIWKEIKKYNKVVVIFNRFITLKNYSIIWYILPFSKKWSF